MSGYVVAPTIVTIRPEISPCAAEVICVGEVNVADVTEPDFPSIVEKKSLIDTPTSASNLLAKATILVLRLLPPTAFSVE